jgi:hypothetical protein
VTLSPCALRSEAELHRFERAALRWLACFCVERRQATLAEVPAAAWAFENMAEQPTVALDMLRRLCSQ